MFYELIGLVCYILNSSIIYELTHSSLLSLRLDSETNDGKHCHLLTKLVLVQVIYLTTMPRLFNVVRVKQAINCE